MVSDEFKDTTVRICSSMSLEIKEVRGSSTCHAYRDGYKEVTRETQTRFHWKLFGIVSELDAAAVKSPDFDLKDQELYNVVFASQAFDLGACLGFGSREVAIRNAVEFAERNGIEIDGYEAIEDKENTHA